MIDIKDVFAYISISLIVISLFLVTYQNDFITGQDSLTYHLPVSRYMAEYNKIPENVPYDLYYRGMSKPPLLYIFTYPFFKIFGANEVVAEIVPFTFLILWLLFLWWWVKKEGGKLEIFLFIIFLSYYTVDLMTWYYQGCVIIFFSTVTFYFWSKYLESKKENWKYLSLFVFFASLSALSKISGAILFLISIMYLVHFIFKKKNWKPILLSIIPIFSVAYWYLIRKVNPPPIYIGFSMMHKSVSQAFIMFFHPEIILFFTVFFIFLYLRKIKKYELELVIFYSLLSLIFIYFSVDPRYPAILSGYAIFFVVKYLSKFKINKIILKVLAVGVIIIFLMNSLMLFANPQKKYINEIRNIKLACKYLREELNITEANVVGDADFGIGWWCKYNYTSMKDYFENKPFNRIDFVVDSWWNFSKDVRGYSEYSDIKRINETHPLKLIWEDEDNKIWKVIEGD